MTTNLLNATKMERDDLQVKLEEAQSRIVDLEQLLLSQAAPNQHNPWQNTIKSATSTSEADFEYKVRLVEERDRLLDQKSQLQDRVRGLTEENGVLKTTLDET